MVCVLLNAHFLTLRQHQTKEWLSDWSLLKELEKFVDDRRFQQLVMSVKGIAKERLSSYIETLMGIKIPSSMLFDVQVKRIHEYKRQLLNILYTIHRYLRIKAMSPEERAKVVPRCVIIGGKAAPVQQQCLSYFSFFLFLLTPNRAYRGTSWQSASSS